MKAPASATQVHILIWMLNHDGLLVESQLATQFGLANTQLTARSLMQRSYIQPIEGYADRYKLTPLGISTAEAQIAREKASAAKRNKPDPTSLPTWFMQGTYDAAELKPFSARSGALLAYALPSRINDQLHYRDGRVESINQTN